MTWAKLSDDYPVQTAPLSDAAFRTHTEALCWTMLRETGGRISDREVQRFAETQDPEKAVEELVRRAFWKVDGGGYLIVHHMEHQPEPDLIAKRRQNGAERARKHRRKLAGLGDNESANSAQTSVPVTAPVPSRPVPSNASRNSVTSDSESTVTPHREQAPATPDQPPCSTCGKPLGSQDHELACNDPWNPRA